VADDEQEEEIALVQMLIEYKKYKETTNWMKVRLEEYGKKFYRQPEKIELPKGKLEKTYSSLFISDT
jgi:hypothetical protein